MRLLKWPETRFNTALDRCSAIPAFPNELISQAHATIGTRPNGSDLPIKAAGARWHALPIGLAAASRLRIRFSPIESAIISLVQESVYPEAPAHQTK
jgi:hypothetical protein